ncbi:Uma2 family endonuclease [Hymenobacter lutimineralis]|uniref:Uma2 family endonuclease n=1 Tax=Hymenobacter lutimineralis TaxID=2606448 RepID=A0A5D6UUG2_9BACT|nr:Uma2 family endonuclease [Hymenobacter lutimineralis]TYZ06558.1 Uma2 family endonuclease [Hymenobacter lutimineralis]
MELIRGRVRLMSPAPRRRHQDITRNIELPIMQFLRGQSCKIYHAPFDVRLVRSTPNGDASIETVVQPDICVICDPQKLDDRGCLGAPDWIIEILLPGNVSRDTKEKFDLYEEAGAGEYWHARTEKRGRLPARRRRPLPPARGVLHARPDTGSHAAGAADGVGGGI